MNAVRKTCFCTFLLIAFQFLQAQNKVTFLIDALPAYHKSDDKIYLAGSFNNWNSSDASRACAYCTANTGLSSVRFDQTLRSMSIGEAYDHRISA